MLTLSHGQVRTLEAAQADVLAARIARDLRRSHPELSRPYDDAQMHASTRRSIETALALGLDHRRDFRLFAFLHLFVHGEFHACAKPKRLLTDDETPRSERAATMMEAMSDADWAALKQERPHAVP